ncbi:imidazole glycerol phosphate synthase subunit HisF [candidate division KSB1 bacterium]
MLAKRIIPCLDVKDGRVVKGKNFIGLNDAGNPVDLAKKYNDEGADELVFLDITASIENRGTMVCVVKEVAKQVFIPFTVGGGIKSMDDIQRMLEAGADKISINTEAIRNPELIRKSAQRFGSQCIVIAIDAKRKGKNWSVFVNGGRDDTGIDAIGWAKEAEKMGAGEILLTSMDKDGTKDGFDIELTRLISQSVNIPVIASGGAGTPASISEVLMEGKADAALAASIFHYKEFSIKETKDYLKDNGVEIRC